MYYYRCVNQQSECHRCSGPFIISEYECPACRITVRGKFELSPLARLSASQSEFLLTFVRCRGVLRDMEAVLGISYPTVRSRLDQVVDAVEALVATAAPIHPQQNVRLSILRQLSRGEITVEEATKLLDILEKSWEGTH